MYMSAAGNKWGRNAVFSQGGRTPLYIAARGSFTTIVDMIIKTARLDYPTVRTTTSHPDLLVSSTTITTSTAGPLHDSPPKAQPAPILTITAAAHHVSTHFSLLSISLSLSQKIISRCLSHCLPQKPNFAKQEKKNCFMWFFSLNFLMLE